MPTKHNGLKNVSKKETAGGQFQSAVKRQNKQMRQYKPIQVMVFNPPSEFSCYDELQYELT